MTEIYLHIFARMADGRIRPFAADCQSNGWYHDESDQIRPMGHWSDGQSNTGINGGDDNQDQEGGGGVASELEGWFEGYARCVCTAVYGRVSR